MGLHWGGGSVLRKEEERYPREPLVLAPNPREEIAPCSLTVTLFAPGEPLL